MRILIVEDEVRLASSLQDLLELGGYSADISHDGESGLDNALTGIYDVVLLDVMLPKLDGFTVLRRMRAAGNATPVLMLTARSEVADKVEGLDCGADYYLTKPFEPQEHPGIGAQGLHIPPLALGIDRVKSQGALAGAREARHHHQLVPGDCNVNVFEVVGASAFYDDLILHREGSPLIQIRAVSSR